MVAGLGGVESGKLEVFNRVPLSRIGQPEEAASVWAFLLSDEAKYSMSSPVSPKNAYLGRFGRPERFIGTPIVQNDVPLLELLCRKNLLAERSQQ